MSIKNFHRHFMNYFCFFLLNILHVIISYIFNYFNSEILYLICRTFFEIYRMFFYIAFIEILEFLLNVLPLILLIIYKNNVHKCYFYTPIQIKRNQLQITSVKYIILGRYFRYLPSLPNYHYTTSIIVDTGRNTTLVPLSLKYTTSLRPII